MANLDRLLKSIGKRVFINCYEVANDKGDDLSIEDLIECDPELKMTKGSGLQTRLSCIKKIFKLGLEAKALKEAKKENKIMSSSFIINIQNEDLQTIFSNGKKYFVPRFQRDYSWDTEQLEDLWEDIFELEENDYHYMGILVMQVIDGKTFKVIDGQQRLTTFSLMVLAGIKRLKELNQEERVEILHNQYIGTKSAITLKYDNKLVLNKNNNFSYKEAVIGEEIPIEKSNSVKLMGKALDFFYKKFNDLKPDEIVDYIVNTSIILHFTTIYVKDEIKAYKIFETFNARGVQLSSGDLLKNYLFILIDKDDDMPQGFIDGLDEKWTGIGSNLGGKNYTEYILTQWNSCHKLIRKVELFKEITTDITNEIKARKYLNQLHTDSRLYGALQNSNHEFWKDNQDKKTIKESLDFLKLFNIKQPLSLLLIAYNKHKSQFSKILKWISIFSLRYNVICSQHNGEQEKLYNKIALQILNDCKIYQIKQELLTLYPQDDIFKRDFIDKTIPTKHSSKKARYLLARLVEKQSGQHIDEEELTIEHILPLKPSEQWQNTFGDHWQLFNQRLGNMALVSFSENKQLEQKDFESKKEILNKSIYKSFNNIDDYQEWYSGTIENRQKKWLN